MQSNSNTSLKYQKFCSLPLRYLIKITIIKISLSFYDASLHDHLCKLKLFAHIERVWI